MIDHFADVDDIALPAAPLDLSLRIRDLRARQGLKQSEIARRMGLDPSIPSLWEQGKRPVPSSRIRALAEALNVSVADLLEGVTDVPRPAKPVVEAPMRSVIAAAPAERTPRERISSERTPLMAFLPTSQAGANPAPPAPEDEEGEERAPAPPRFQPTPRPALVGWIPDGWEPSDRVQDINPSLPDGYWLDPVRLERSTARDILRSRLCEADQELIADREVPGAAMAERIWQHCGRREDFVSSRLPLVEAIFRAVLISEYGGLPADTLCTMLRDRAGAMPLTPALLRRMRDSVRGYPMRWVDRELFR